MLAINTVTIKSICKDHYRSLRPKNGNRISVVDKLEMVSVSLVPAVAVSFSDVQLSSLDASMLIVALCVVIGVLGRCNTTILSLSSELAATTEPSSRTTRRAELLSMLSSNAMYGVVAAIVTALPVLVAGHVSGRWLETVALFMAVSSGAHLVLVLLLVITRVHCLTLERLLVARVGDDDE